MATSVKSYAKINLGLRIGPKRADGFHGLRTLYTTIDLHDRITVEIEPRGAGISILCDHPAVPCDSTNTCYRAAELVLAALNRPAKVAVTIHKELPVQGGLGAASANAVATIFGLERAFGQSLPAQPRSQIAAEIGSDLNLFLYGGLVLGTGRGEEVWPLADLPSIPVVVVTPEVGVSTPKAFAAWDSLTAHEGSSTMNEFNQLVYEWLSASFPTAVSGVPVMNGSQAETLLLDLVRTGISNDFERVVFPEIPALREVKCALQQVGAVYASLSGSGSSLYGLFRTAEEAAHAAKKLNDAGMRALATRTLPRGVYWREMFE